MRGIYKQKDLIVKHMMLAHTDAVKQVHGYPNQLITKTEQLLARYEER